ncbi:Phosphate regulon transcriptional regulatory protein PhoB (SphR) [Dehalobacter sp. UNSWDHB]|jgi:Response regulators consisting of a CheY-like receiver domain and a winged-helix DNA-binding domain|uniref:response regulator transcription factor n=1 Tax=unclassified Dehalobacter TaxID=2635733 RepID=UPI00028B8947|nr:MULTISPECIES: response regulator transcription factor [unclassified Dehalobacter]AFV03779.1 Phosphate regulon transcriptional regulatory protein PhoB (SphR) [Dehalobacter sp. DCA]AFV06765.1 Phosphate regulon transcriptional regulatory protein PhoB (SphR) [Dehalobacter sp. CF]EQB21656.1 Phosphate regulon transcriptional regulatory protein PhoB (SphR) [Dehalobacter sp. UNSWDHB]
MTAGNILIADDEIRMRKLVADFLKKEGYTVIEAEDGKQALDIIHSGQHISLAILDVMMPETDGWTVCREIRKSGQTPVIMLTARSEESDELFGFDLGADEYITKPFSPLILVARVQALLRRTSDPKASVKNLDGLEIDKNRRVVSIDGERVDLSPKEYELLLYLVDNESLAVSREQILNSVWDYDYYGDARTVDTHIKRLRYKLGIKGDFIQTVRGLGYRFEII